MVDAAVDAVGFEGKGHGHDGHEAPATVLNSVMEVTRQAGKLGIVGLYVTGDPARLMPPPSRAACRSASDSAGRSPTVSPPVSAP